MRRPAVRPVPRASRREPRHRVDRCERVERDPDLADLQLVPAVGAVTGCEDDVLVDQRAPEQNVRPGTRSSAPYGWPFPSGLPPVTAPAGVLEPSAIVEESDDRQQNPYAYLPPSIDRAMVARLATNFGSTSRGGAPRSVWRAGCGARPDAQVAGTRPVAARDRDVELGVAQHSVFRDVEPRRFPCGSTRIPNVRFIAQRAVRRGERERPDREEAGRLHAELVEVARVPEATGAGRQILGERRPRRCRSRASPRRLPSRAASAIGSSRRIRSTSSTPKTTINPRRRRSRSRPTERLKPDAAVTATSAAMGRR